MTPDQAIDILCLTSPCTIDEARVAFRTAVREHHPDVAGEASTARAAQITQAFALLRRLAADGDGRTIDVRRSPRPVVTEAESRPTERPAGRPMAAYEEAVAAELASGDTVLVHAPPPETFAALFEAASEIGHIGYFDRDLGILEIIVRFEGGPSCSVLATLQGRSHGTEVFCTMESIESTPAPAARPVVEALVEALRSSAS